MFSLDLKIGKKQLGNQENCRSINKVMSIKYVVSVSWTVLQKLLPYVLSSAAAATESRLNEEKIKNRKILITLFDIVRHLALGNNAFRGHDETGTSSNAGKFQEEVNFVAKYDNDLKNWLNSKPGNVSFLSKSIQNEMIQLLTNGLTKNILDEIKENTYFTVQCDEVASHNKEFMSIVLRYVYDNKIRERLISLKRIESMTGRSLANVIIETLSDCQLQLEHVIGKSFDGASNMAGQNEGVQRHLTDAGASMSTYVHCYGHCLNLVLVDCAQNLPCVSSVFDCIGSIYNVLKYPLRHGIYEKYLKECGIKTGRTKLSSQSETRWTARVDNLNCFINAYPALYKTLDEFKYTDSVCNGILITISSLEFVLKVLVLQRIFSLTKYASDYLQKKDMDLPTAVDAVKGLKHSLTLMRTETKFSSFYEEAVNKQSQFGPPNTNDDVRPKRRRVLPQRLETDVVVYESIGLNVGVGTDLICLKNDFFYMVIDRILSELNRRFNDDSNEIMTCVSAFDPRKWNEDQSNKVQQLARRFNMDHEMVVEEYLLLSRSTYFLNMKDEFAQKTGVPMLPTILNMFTGNDLANLYPQIYKLLIIASCLPVTTATCERTHSKVKIINNYLRASMTDSRLENLILLSCERELTKKIELTTMACKFAEKPRKLPL